MGEQGANNPFAALFSATNPSQGSQQNMDPSNSTNDEDTTLDYLARDVFFITCKKNPTTPLVFLEMSKEHFDITLLGEALFERLLLVEPENHVVPNGTKFSSHIIEGKLIIYLFESWSRLQQSGSSNPYW
jgi:hypothetical protein